MNINKHNYEAFFLDYHEGNLSPQQVADLLLFVEQHPELKEEFESFENFSLEDFSFYEFDNKQGLKKEITEQNREEYFMRSVDQSLNAAETELLLTYLKQHPQYAAELDLFQKTRLVPDTNIFFENRESLKKVSETADQLLISAVEGLLSKQEHSLLNQQLEVDVELRKDLALYQKTKLKADLSVVYKNKEDLKRSEKKVIPFFYYVSGVAAAILLLMGLSFLFNKTAEQDIAKNVLTPKQETLPGKQEKFSLKENISIEATVASSVITKTNKVKSPASLNSNASVNVNSVTVNVQPEKEVLNSPELKEQPQEQFTARNAEPAVNPSIGVKETDTDKSSSPEYLSLAQIAAAKIKEKTLDAEVLAMEQKTGRMKKFSGWDALQVIAKGVSKLTGKKVEAKPTYNEEGEVTAYALAAGGFQITRAK
jgi:hypothetical protein